MENLKHDVLAQIGASDLGELVKSIGVVVQGERNLVTASFVKPLVTGWAALMAGLVEHVKVDGTRLFICGHSMGGAQASLFAFILAEGKVSGTIPIMKRVKSIHIVSFGAPCILSDTSRNTFNRHLESGLVTLDRVVNQKVAARSAATQVIMGGILGPNDVIPTVPAGFSHPGFRPLATNMNPEAGGRPYSIDNVRKFYGVPTNTRYRDSSTWPFEEGLELGDWKNSKALDAIVKRVTGGLEAGEISVKIPDEIPAKGGFGKQKNIYAAMTKNHIPDFVSVAGSNWSTGFAHAEYLGMFYFGGFRLPGMKNPGYGNRTAYFSLSNSGVHLSYVDSGLVPVWPPELSTAGTRRLRKRSSKTRRSKNGLKT
jgi:hypothetical protein